MGGVRAFRHSRHPSVEPNCCIRWRVTAKPTWSVQVQGRVTWALQAAAASLPDWVSGGNPVVDRIRAAAAARVGETARRWDAWWGASARRRWHARDRAWVDRAADCGLLTTTPSVIFAPPAADRYGAHGARVLTLAALPGVGHVHLPVWGSGRLATPGPSVTDTGGWGRLFALFHEIGHCSVHLEQDPFRPSTPVPDRDAAINRWVLCPAFRTNVGCLWGEIAADALAAVALLHLSGDDPDVRRYLVGVARQRRESRRTAPVLTPSIGAAAFLHDTDGVLRALLADPKPWAQRTGVELRQAVLEAASDAWLAALDPGRLDANGTPQGTGPWETVVHEASQPVPDALLRELMADAALGQEDGRRSLAALLQGHPVGDWLACFRLHLTAEERDQLRPRRHEDTPECWARRWTPSEGFVAAAWKQPAWQAVCHQAEEETRALLPQHPVSVRRMRL